MSRSTRCKTNYLFRTTEDAGTHTLSYKIQLRKLISPLAGTEIHEDKYAEIGMAPSEGGLGLNTATEDFANEQLPASRMMSYGLVSSILYDEPLPTKEATEAIRKSISDAQREGNKQCCSAFKADCSPEDLRRCEEKRSPGASL